MHKRVMQPSRWTMTCESNPKDDSSLMALNKEQSQVLSLGRNSPSTRTRWGHPAENKTAQHCYPSAQHWQWQWAM